MTDKPDEQQAPDPGAAGAAGQSADPADDFVTTHHVITVDGEQLPYTATAGRVVLRQEGHTEDKFDGPKARAEVFMTAYTLGDGAATRPVTFAFNGGPGSSSVWLHLGLLGPRRVLSGDVGALLPPPYDIAALNHYVRTELGYKSDLPYEILTDRVQPWSFKEFEGVHVQVLDKLAEAMRVNPHMRVHVACGYYDAATPYFAAEHSVAHLAIPADLAGNIEFAYYEAGHMMYLHEPSRHAQSARLAVFVTGDQSAPAG